LVITVTLLVLVSQLDALPKDKEQKIYPEKGTVVAIHLSEHPYTIPSYTDGDGKTRSGVSITYKTPIFRVETETKFYELEGGKKDSFNLGDAIQFRIEKNSAYVQRGSKEQKLQIIGMDLKEKK
jgi:hypothetical protein